MAQTKEKCLKISEKMKTIKYFQEDLLNPEEDNIELFETFARECLRNAYSKLRKLFAKEQKNKYIELMCIFTICFAYSFIIKSE